MLYLVAVTERPAAKEAGEGKQEKVVVQPKVMIARTGTEVVRAMLMSGDIPKGTDPDRTTVVSVPFSAAPV